MLQTLEYIYLLVAYQTRKSQPQVAKYICPNLRLMSCLGVACFFYKSQPQPLATELLIQKSVYKEYSIFTLQCLKEGVYT